jgi:hypothetical protein
MIDGTPANQVQSFEAQAFNETIGKLNAELDELNKKYSTISDTLYSERANVRKLYEAISDYVKDNDLSVDDDIPLAELDEMLFKAFTHHISFVRNFTVQVRYYVDATFNVEATNEGEARDLAEDYGIYNIDFDVDVEDWAVDRSDVQEVTQA